MIPMIDIGQRLAHSSKKYTPPPEEEEEEAVEQDTEGRREWRKAGEQGKEERRTEEGGGEKEEKEGKDGEKGERKRKEGRQSSFPNTRTVARCIRGTQTVHTWRSNRGTVWHSNSGTMAKGIQSSFSGIRPSVMGSIPRWPTLFVSGRNTPIWVPCRNTAGVMCPSR